MLNIFNLFLFLLALWIMFMVAAGKLSWLYIFFGIVASALVSFSSFRLKLIEEKSELLHLSLGFYRHFMRIYFKGFSSAVRLVINLALAKEPSHPLVFTVKFDNENKFNPALLIASFNMTTGLFCIGAKEGELVVHAIDAEHFQAFDLNKNCKSLANVNDDNLV